MTDPVNINQVPKLNLGLQETDEVFITRGGSGPYRVPASSFPWERKGDKGDPGGSWAPVLAVVTDGARRVHRIVGWTGGTGVEPTTTGYIGSTGIVSNIAEAVDLRGLQGNAGWAPVLALVADGARLVHQVVDWTGGAGAKPGVGWYVGVTGLVELITDAVNVRGATGGVGWSPVLAVVPDRNRRVQQIVDWIAGAGAKPTALGYIGAAGIVETAAAAVDVTGTQGNAGWTPMLAIVADGERRVQRVVDWTGGAGTKPETLGYIGTAGIVATAAAAVDVRGAQGNAGWAPVLAIVADGERRVQRVVDWTGGAGTKPETLGYIGTAGIVATAAAAVDVRGAVGIMTAGQLAVTLAAGSEPDKGNIRQAIGMRYAGNLSGWTGYRGATARKLAIVGDSTSYLIQQSPANLNYLNTQYVNNAGSPLYGVTIAFFGANGNTLANFLVGIPAGYGLADVIAASPTVDGSGYGVHLSYGINDIRLQANGNTAATLAAMLRQAVNYLRAALPKVSICLRVPNSFLSADVNGLGYVVPNSWAQGASDALRDAYYSLRYEWDSVVVWDSRGTIFQDTCPASSSLMADQLHPTVAPNGFRFILDGIAKVWSVRSEYSPGAAQDAQAGGYADDYIRYPRIVENGIDYDLITSGSWVASGSSYLDFSGDVTKIGGFRRGDIVIQDGSSAFALPPTFASLLQGSNIRLASLGASLPNAQTGGMVYVYRRRFAGMSLAKSYVDGATGGASRVYPYVMRASLSAGAGNGYARLQVNSGDKSAALFNLRTSDTLLHPTLGAVTGFSFGEFSTDAVQINKAGADFTMPANLWEMIAVGSDRNVSQPDINHIMFGALTSSTLRTVCNGGGIYATCVASLGTAGTSITTVVIARNGTNVATITFAPGSTTGAVAWTTGSQFCTLAGRVFTATVTPGAGAADLITSFSA